MGKLHCVYCPVLPVPRLRKAASRYELLKLMLRRLFVTFKEFLLLIYRPNGVFSQLQRPITTAADGLSAQFSPKSDESR